MSDQWIAYDMVCHTDGCILFEKTNVVYGPENSAFLCGPCGVMVYDWKISGT